MYEFVPSMFSDLTVQVTAGTLQINENGKYTTKLFNTTKVDVPRDSEVSIVIAKNGACCVPRLSRVDPSVYYVADVTTSDKIVSKDSLVNGKKFSANGLVSKLSGNQVITLSDKDVKRKKD